MKTSSCSVGSYQPPGAEILCFLTLPLAHCHSNRPSLFTASSALRHRVILHGCHEHDPTQVLQHPPQHPADHKQHLLPSTYIDFGHIHTRSTAPLSNNPIAHCAQLDLNRKLPAQIQVLHASTTSNHTCVPERSRCLPDIVSTAQWKSKLAEVSSIEHQPIPFTVSPTFTPVVVLAAISSMIASHSRPARSVAHL